MGALEVNEGIFIDQMVTVAFAGEEAVQAASLVITPAVVQTVVPVLAQPDLTLSSIELEAGRTSLCLCCQKYFKLAGVRCNQARCPKKP